VSGYLRRLLNPILFIMNISFSSTSPCSTAFHLIAALNCSKATGSDTTSARMLRKNDSQSTGDGQDTSNIKTGPKFTKI